MVRLLTWLVSGEEHPARVRAVRALFFLLVGVDAWNQVSHASRYGAGHFNVSHFPALDGLIPVPEASWVLLSAVLQAWLAFCVALGLSLRRNLALLALLNGLTYFASQLNSYQHHFLLWLMLTAAAGAAWLERDPRELPAWSLRVMRVQVAITYAWTTVTKLDPDWVSGRALASQITLPEARALLLTPAGWLGLSEANAFAAAATLTIALELFLAAAFLWPRRLGTVALPLGVAFHLGVEASGFEIGMFSYYMVALYLLVAPEWPFQALGRWVRPSPHPEPSALSWRLVGAGLAVLLVSRVPLAVSGALALAVAVLSLTGQAGPRAALGRAAASALLLACHLGTDQVRDHYRFMGGDARRRGQTALAITAYSQVVRIDPAYVDSWLRLGQLHEAAGDLDAAVAALEGAHAAAPTDPEPLQRLLQLHKRRGDPAAARAVAERLLRVSPGDASAREVQATGGR